MTDLSEYRGKMIAIGLSGGVDSAVAALRLVQAGVHVIGITMKQDPAMDTTDAERVAAALGIPWQAFDLREAFEERVIQPFVQAYLQGRTPNPCNLCNPGMKWGALWDCASALGAEMMATGHYASLVTLPNGRRALMRRQEDPKDQTYALYGLTQEMLLRTVMPLSGMDKNEIRRIAAEANLPVAQKAESQDICFVPDGDYAAYVERYVREREQESRMQESRMQPDQVGHRSKNTDPSVAVPGVCLPSAISPGNFVLTDGRVIGRHRGIIHYTIGQRKGLGIAWSEPLFVVRIDGKRNEVVLGTGEEVWSDRLICRDLNWSAIAPPQEPIKVTAKIRYAHKGAEAEVRMISSEGQKGRAEGQTGAGRTGSGQTGAVQTGAGQTGAGQTGAGQTGAGQTAEEYAEVRFFEPVRAITSGQAVVFYDGDILLGGGVIE